MHLRDNYSTLIVSWIVNCKYFIIHSPQGFSGVIYNTGCGTLPGCLGCNLQVNEGMSNDAPIYECENEIDHYTGNYVPYSLRRVCGLFNFSQIYYMYKGSWDGVYSLSSLSEKTRKSNRFQMLLQRQHFILSYLKTLSVGPAGVWTYGLPLSRPALSPMELTGRRLKSRICHSFYSGIVQNFCYC